MIGRNDGKTDSRRALRACAGSRRSRRGRPDLQESILGAADGEHRGSPGVLGVLSEVPETSMSASSTVATHQQPGFSPRPLQTTQRSLTVAAIAPLRFSSRIAVGRERILIAKPAVTGTRCLALIERIEAAIRWATKGAVLSTPRAIGVRATAGQEQTGKCDCSDRNWAHSPTEFLTQ